MTRISVSGSRGGSKAGNGLGGNSLSLLGAQSSSMIIGSRGRGTAGGDHGHTGGGSGLRPHHNLVGGSHVHIQPLYAASNTSTGNRGTTTGGTGAHHHGGLPSGGIISHLSKSLEQNQNRTNLSLAERNNERNERRKYTEMITNLKKKEKQNRELLEQISKKLKTQEKKSTEETKISIELKKRHDIM